MIDKLLDKLVGDYKYGRFWIKFGLACVVYMEYVFWRIGV